jgi:hypothetical protein
MKIENVRVLNNYKVKLTNVRLAGVNSISHTISEQGTRFPIIITPPVEPPTFAERYERVFDYLIARYEPGWTAATVELGKAATMSLMGVSDGINPLILGNATEDLYNVTTGNSDVGYFNTLTHPKLFAAAVQSAYGKFERARVSEKANHRFIDYNQNSIYCQNNLINGGNAFFGLHPNFKWFPDTDRSVSNLSMGLSANYDNKIHRIWMIAPYGHMSSPMHPWLNGSWRRLPWINDHYIGENWRFDGYLIMRESTTIRDLLNDVTTIRSLTGGIIQGGTTDTYLNTSYRGLSYPAGYISKVFDDSNRVFGGFGGTAVAIGSPWIPFPNGISLPNGWWSASQGICFNPQTLVMFDGSTFPNTPPLSYDSASFVPNGPQNDVVGICWAYGEELIASLDALSDAWGNSMEFTGLIGDLPHGPIQEFAVPMVLYKDPTVAENVRYYRWRLDAAVSHWKSKFKSPIDGFAHVFANSSSIVERTFHKWNGVTFNQFTNEVAGTSFIENIPVAWARDQYNYTHGPSSDAEMGVVLGIESFGQYMFKDDQWIVNPQLSSQQRYNGDPNPRHWCLDDDKAANLYTAPDHMTLGQRKWGITYSNSIWGMGICGTSTLGEIDTVCNPTNIGSSDSIMSGYPFMYNTFAHVVDGHLTWKTIPNTSFNGTTEGIPWKYDRRFRLFHLYPTLLALNTTIVDFFHCSNGYNFESGWFDKDLGNNFSSHWQTSSNPTTPARNNWTGIARTSEFELLYACMKGGLTAGLDSLGFTELHDELFAGNI